MEKILEKIKRAVPARLLSALSPPWHFLLALCAAFRYGFPARTIRVIGVTGTKGKTTTVHLIHEILAESGAKVASASSVRFKIGERETQNDLKMTMPGRFFTQKFLRDTARAGCRYAVLEVTSQGIAQYRHRWIRFHAAVMTNVASEHLESHGGFEKYLRAKLDLFWRLPQDSVAVINRDDPSWQRFSAATPARKMFYQKTGIERDNAARQISDVALTDRGISFRLGDTLITSPLPGEFNFYNILAAVSVGLALHIAPERIASAVARVAGVPGRMEFVRRDPFAVVVDYAHTPDSLKAVYVFLKENQKPKTKNQKLICVFGAAGGGRDKWKRPEFAKIAEQFCAEIILTDEDPYDENPESILDDIQAGFSSRFLQSKMSRILDRRAAIREAINRAQSGDAVIITGKGAEPWIMGPAGSKIPWDDRAVVREEIQATGQESDKKLDRK